MKKVVVADHSGPTCSFEGVATEEGIAKLFRGMRGDFKKGERVWCRYPYKDKQGLNKWREIKTKKVEQLDTLEERLLRRRLKVLRCEVAGEQPTSVDMTKLRKGKYNMKMFYDTQEGHAVINQRPYGYEDCEDYD